MRHHPSCRPSDNILAWICSQCGNVEPVAEEFNEIDRLRAQNAELRTVLARAQALRGDLLGQLSYVPECVLDFCNRAREVLTPH